MGVSEGIRPIAELWQGSSLDIPPVDSSAAVLQSGWDALPLAAAILLVVILLFFRTLSEALAGSAEILFVRRGPSNIAHGPAFRLTVTLTAVLCVPTLSVILVATGISTLTFVQAILVFPAYLALRQILNHFAVQIVGREIPRSVFKLQRSMLILITATALPALIIPLARPGGGIWASVAAIYLAIIFLAAAIRYVIAVLKIIPEMRFSYFFTFLYLCGVELLPLAATVKVLLD